MASTLPIKARVISSSSCSLSDAATFLNEYICGSSTADPMVKGYLQNVVQAIDGMVSRRRDTRADILPRKQKSGSVEERLDVLPMKQKSVSVEERLDFLPRKQKSASVEERLDVRERGEGEALRGRSGDGVSFLTRKGLGLSEEELGFEETLTPPARKQGNGSVERSVGSARKKKAKRTDVERSDVAVFQETETGIDVPRKHSKGSISDGEGKNHTPKKKRRKEGGQDEQLRPSKDHSLTRDTNIGHVNENDEAKNGKDRAAGATGEVFVEKFQASDEKRRRKEHKKMRLQSERKL